MRSRPSRSAFVMTDTDDNAIAAAAIICLAPLARAEDRTLQHTGVLNAPLLIRVPYTAYCTRWRQFFDFGIKNSVHTYRHYFFSSKTRFRRKI